MQILTAMIASYITTRGYVFRRSDDEAANGATAATAGVTRDRR